MELKVGAYLIYPNSSSCLIHDGHTLELALQQVEKLTGKAPRTTSADRGYRGTTQIGDTQEQIPKLNLFEISS